MKILLDESTLGEALKFEPAEGFRRQKHQTFLSSTNQSSCDDFYFLVLLALSNDLSKKKV